MNLGVRIVKIRKSSGLSQVEFAEQYDLSLSALKSYERGATEPPPSFLANLCKRCAISAEWLLLGEGTELSRDIIETLEYSVIFVRQYVVGQRPNTTPEREAQYASIVFNIKNSDKNASREMIENILLKAA